MESQYKSQEEKSSIECDWAEILTSLEICKNLLLEDTIHSQDKTEKFDDYEAKAGNSDDSEYEVDHFYVRERPRPLMTHEHEPSTSEKCRVLLAENLASQANDDKVPSEDEFHSEYSEKNIVNKDERKQSELKEKTSNVPKDDADMNREKPFTPEDCSARIAEILDCLEICKNLLLENKIDSQVKTEKIDDYEANSGNSDDSEYEVHHFYVRERPRPLKTHKDEQLEVKSRDEIIDFNNRQMLNISKITLKPDLPKINDCLDNEKPSTSKKCWARLAENLATQVVKVALEDDVHSEDSEKNWVKGDERKQPELKEKSANVPKNDGDLNREMPSIPCISADQVDLLDLYKNQKPSISKNLMHGSVDCKKSMKAKSVTSDFTDAESDKDSFEVKKKSMSKKRKRYAFEDNQQSASESEEEAIKNDKKINKPMMSSTSESESDNDDDCNCRMPTMYKNISNIGTSNNESDHNISITSTDSQFDIDYLNMSWGDRVSDCTIYDSDSELSE